MKRHRTKRRRTEKDLINKSLQIRRREYRKNWSMVHDDKRYSRKREQAEKTRLKEISREDI